MWCTHWANVMGRERRINVWLLSFILLYSSYQVLGSIDCFKCASVNRDNPACEDPFHNNFSMTILESPCMAGRKHRQGLFPATACVKLSGVYADGQSIVVRACALDSGTLTTDTEIIRMSHCGAFYYDNKYVKGCLQSCDDADGCNSSPGTSSTIFSLVLPLVTFIGGFYLKK